LIKRASWAENSGVKVILVRCVYGLKGFPGAVITMYLETQIQLPSGRFRPCH